MDLENPVNLRSHAQGDQVPGPGNRMTSFWTPFFPSFCVGYGLPLANLGTMLYHGITFGFRARALAEVIGAEPSSASLAADPHDPGSIFATQRDRRPQKIAPSCHSTLLETKSLSTGKSLLNHPGYRPTNSSGIRRNHRFRDYSVAKVSTFGMDNADNAMNTMSSRRCRKRSAV